MLKFTNEIDLIKIEEGYAELHAQRANSKIDFLIPTRAKFIGVAAFASFIQLLVTWKRLNNSGNLIIGTKSINQEDIESVVKRFYGLIASTISWNSGIVNFNGEDIKPLIRTENSRLMTALLKKNFDHAARGDSINLPFFDHIGSNRGLLPIVYQDQKLCSESEFKNLTNALITIGLKNNHILRLKFNEISEDINSILFELFENTHKWARKSFDEELLDPSYRGIYATFYKIDDKSISNYLNSTGLYQYFYQLLTDVSDSIKFITLLEISVTDSGSGLVSRFAEKDVIDMTLEDEYSILRTCLTKHQTSHKDFSDAQGRGIGLHRIMELLDKKNGFLRVRSGRMNLYRDFLKHRFYSSSTNRPNYVLLDWDTNSTLPTERPKAEGTCITLIIPHLIF